MDVEPPTSWPAGKFSLLRSGSACPQFLTSGMVCDTRIRRDYLNGNNWPRESNGFPGKMKQDGFEFHYCTKNKGTGDYPWPSGNYCIFRFGKRCPNGFDTGSILWDDENDFNSNFRKGTLPNGVYNQDTKIFFCCRDDGQADLAIDLPVTRPFYLMRYNADCQKVRKMDATDEIVQFDDNDNDNINNSTGATPLNTGNPTNHQLHYCLYTPK